MILKKSKGIKCIQIHIHRDEGKSKDDLNYHAHMIFDWQDEKTGKMLRLNKLDMSEIQSLVAKSLNMKRGILKTNSNRERLEPIEYKRQQEELKLKELQKQRFLEEKKNRDITKRFEEEARKIAFNTGKFKFIKNRTLRQRALEIQQEYIAKALEYVGEDKERNEQIKKEYRQLEKVYSELKKFEIEFEEIEKNIKWDKRRIETAAARTKKLTREIEQLEE